MEWGNNVLGKNICTYEEDMSVKAWGRGGGCGLKAIAEMSAKNVGLFRTSPI